MHSNPPCRILAGTLAIVLCVVPLILRAQDPEQQPLTVIAVGDAGYAGSDWKASAFYITDMFTGRHNAGKPDLLLFLGDNFIPLGLNVASGDVEGTVQDLLRPLHEVLAGMPRDRVHAIPGESDYYARYAEEKSEFFGLIRSGEGPTGLSDKGNAREAAMESWTFHYGAPAQTVLPCAQGSPDSVQLIFFDSAILLRTDPSRWHGALASLRTILDESGTRKGIIWRVLCAHHPWYSVGVHGGYALWDDETGTVGYLTDCDMDSNAAGYIRNWMDPEDLCALRYRQYTDSLKAVVRQSGVRIQMMLAAHDRSLQLLSYPAADPGCEGCPRVHIISGAASLPSRVKLPTPPAEFTSSGTNLQDEGMSPPGFVQLRFERERIRAIFFNARNGERLDMGGGRRTFWIGRDGSLTESHGPE